MDWAAYWVPFVHLLLLKFCITGNALTQPITLHWTVVVVQWLACKPPTLMIRVRIPLRFIVFILKVDWMERMKKWKNKPGIGLKIHYYSPSTYNVWADRILLFQATSHLEDLRPRRAKRNRERVASFEEEHLFGGMVRQCVANTKYSNHLLSDQNENKYWRL